MANFLQAIADDRLGVPSRRAFRWIVLCLLLNIIIGDKADLFIRRSQRTRRRFCKACRRGFSSASFCSS